MSKTGAFKLNIPKKTSRILLLFLIMVVLIVFFSFASPGFSSVNTIMNIIKQNVNLAILALGVTFIIMIAGTDLSTGANIALSLYHYMAVHDIEWMVSCALPAKVVKVYSQWTDRKNKVYNAQDTAFNQFTFDNGIVACVQTCWALPDNASLGLVGWGEIIGTKGVSYINHKGEGLEIIQDHSETVLPDLSYWPEYNGHVEGVLKEEIAHFVTATLNNSEYRVNTDNAIEAVSVIDACFESLETGLPVEIKR